VAAQLRKLKPGPGVERRGGLATQNPKRSGNPLPVACCLLPVACFLFVLIVAACDGQQRPSPQELAGRKAAYPAVLSAADRERADLAAQWRAARDPQAESKVLDRASAALARIVAESILPAWNGTPWSLGGTALGPGEKPVACGYFVSTALEHAGLRVERRRLGQQAAENIVRTLVPADRVARFRRAPLDLFLHTVAGGGDGVYVVGLDYHVGFLVIEGGTSFFHHASRQAGQVVREPAVLSRALATSSYRVVGKLFDRGLARTWLAGSAVPTHID
jgi:hypothetical protein